LVSFKHLDKTSSVVDVSVKTHKTKFSFSCYIWPMNIIAVSLNFLKNVESHFAISWNCLHQRCFKLYTSFK